MSVQRRSQIPNLIPLIKLKKHQQRKTLIPEMLEINKQKLINDVIFKKYPIKKFRKIKSIHFKVADISQQMINNNSIYNINIKMRCLSSNAKTQGGQCKKFKQSNFEQFKPFEHQKILNSKLMKNTQDSPYLDDIETQVGDNNQQTNKFNIYESQIIHQCNNIQNLKPKNQGKLINYIEQKMEQHKNKKIIGTKCIEKFFHSPDWGFYQQKRFKNKIMQKQKCPVTKIYTELQSFNRLPSLIKTKFSQTRTKIIKN